MNSLGTVLIVDNDELTLIELERILEGAGFRTTTTWDVSEAVRLLNVNTYDYILVSECWSGNTGKLLQGKSAAVAQRCVILSPRSSDVGVELPSVGPITVCKHHADDVLRVLSGPRHGALARAA